MLSIYYARYVRKNAPFVFHILILTDLFYSNNDNCNLTFSVSEEREHEVAPFSPAHPVLFVFSVSEGISESIP